MLRRLPAPASMVALLAVAFACASPTLPLPPPEAPTQLRGPDADHIALSAGCGGAEASALVVIVNTNPAVPGDEAVSGAIADPTCGKWDAPSVFAHNGDVLNITQQLGQSVSTAEIIQVRVP